MIHLYILLAWQVHILWQVHPLSQWFANDVSFEFWGDNVDTRKDVCDVRSDHHGSLLHMYSILAGCSRTPEPHLSRSGRVANLLSLPSQTFLPTTDDIHAVQSNPVILVNRILTQFTNDLSPLCYSKAYFHKYSQQMASKSEVVVVNCTHEK